MTATMTRLAGLSSTEEQIEFASIEDALDAIALGLMVVVMDDESRENEGDLIMAAKYAGTDKAYANHSPVVIGDHSNCVYIA